MKRVRRNIFNVVSVVSLLLFLGTTGQWLRSYWLVDEWFVIYKGEGSARGSTRRGSLVLRHDSPTPGKAYGGIQRVTHRSVREDSLMPDDLWPRDSTVHQ